MDRMLLKANFTKNRIPPWPCPTCKGGVLHLKKDGFLFDETSSSKKAHKHEDWEPEWIEYAYTLILECSNKSCKEIVTNSGIGSVEYSYEYTDDYPEEKIEDTFKPKYFYPPLILFDIPETVPDDVKSELMQSFELFFCNPPSSANHVRIALEKLLNYLKIKRFGINKAKKKIYISLHHRIEITSVKYPNLGDYFLALKWLGNAGSHSEKKISIDDVMDSYNIFEFVLNELFKNDSIKKLVKQINKKKGPKQIKV